MPFRFPRCLAVRVAVAWMAVLHAQAVAPLAHAATPVGRFGHSAAYDQTRDQMITFGGYNGAYLNDVWVLPLGAGGGWLQLTPSGTPPAAREFHTAVYDPARDRMLVFGGYDGGVLYNDVWALSLGPSPSWSKLTVANNPPSPRYHHASFYDPVRDRVIIVGGSDGASRNDVWALRLSTGAPSWGMLFPTGTKPTARSGHSVIYDSIRDRMVVFAGFDTSGEENDVWEMTLGTTPAWAQLAPNGAPPTGRDTHVAIFDQAGDRMVIFGGYDENDRNDTWQLGFPDTTWTELLPSGALPAPRDGHSGVFDSQRRRLVVFGGWDGDANAFTNSSAALALAGPLAWGPATSGGGSVDVPPAGPVTQLELASGYPNPARDQTTIRFALPRAGHASLAIYDLAGRRVRALLDGEQPAGPSSAIWDGRDQSGTAAPPGVYLCVLQSGGERLARRLALLR